ncbi:MAG: hypothetical protein DHS20C12_06120 [Pseudohongiella sp.]|nr:MAG: hypothetical protein DHS20C12_06120 [Pseudohongiella sp.]
MNELFSSTQNNSILKGFKIKIDAIPGSNEFEKGRNDLIRLVIGAMSTRPEEWERSCQININWIGDQFINRLAEDKALEKERLDDICSSCFRFLFELYLSTKNDLATEFERARRFAIENIAQFESRAREQIEYAVRDMPTNLLKQLMNSEAIDSIKEFNQFSSRAEGLKHEWQQEIDKKTEEVKALKDVLDSYKNAFNFVGLYDGFNDLATEKKAEADGLIKWMILLAILAVVPVAIELGFIYKHITNIVAVRDALLVSIFPTLSILAICIYYFRVFLYNHKSLKTQLLQIELRKTLCRFIQHYADYAKDIKTKDNDSLSKFEDIIFSGIVLGEEDIPPTYGGIEQLNEILKFGKSQ